MAEQKESSVLFSLKELMSLEENRIKEEEADKEAVARAEAEAKAAAERAAREAEERRLRMEELAAQQAHEQQIAALNSDQGKKRLKLVVGIISAVLVIGAVVIGITLS